MYELIQPLQRLVEAFAHLRGSLFFQEFQKLDHDLLVQLQAPGLLVRKIFKKMAQLLQRLLTYLGFDVLLIIILGLDNDEKFFQKPWNAPEHIDICDRMQCFDPLDEYHLAVLVLRGPELFTNSFDQLIQIKHQTFVQRAVHDVFEQVVNFFGIIFDITIR